MKPQQCRSRRAIFHLVVLLCLVNLTTGCFPTQPIEGDPAPQSDVRVVLTEEAALRISRQADRPVGAVSGRVMQVNGDSLVLAVRWREVAGGSTSRAGPDVVRLHRSEIESMGQPRFSLHQTLILAGVTAIVVAAIVGGIMRATTGSGEDDDPTNDDNPPQN